MAAAEWIVVEVDASVRGWKSRWIGECDCRWRDLSGSGRESKGESKQGWVIAGGWRRVGRQTRVVGKGVGGGVWR